MFADHRGYTAAHWAASSDDSDIVELILLHNPDIVKATTRRGMTVLHVAVMNNAIATVNMMLGVYADVGINTANQWGETPLHLAAAMGRIDIIERFIDKGAQKDLMDKWGRTPQMVIVGYNCLGSF